MTPTPLLVKTSLKGHLWMCTHSRPQNLRHVVGEKVGPFEWNFRCLFLDKWNCTFFPLELPMKNSIQMVSAPDVHEKSGNACLVFARTSAHAEKPILRGGERGEECSPVMTDRSWHGFHFAEVGWLVFIYREKSQTIGDFIFFRPSQILPIYRIDMHQKSVPDFPDYELFICDRGTGAQQFRGLVMCEIHHRRKPMSQTVQIWVSICREWSPTIAEILDTSGK